MLLWMPCLTLIGTAVLVVYLMLGQQQEDLLGVGGQALHDVRHGTEGKGASLLDQQGVLIGSLVCIGQVSGHIVP